MKNIRNRMLFVLILTGVWCLLNEKFTLKMIVSGIAVSVITYVLLYLLQPDKNKDYSYGISFFTFLKFFVVLIVSIYESAFETIIHLIKNEVNPQFVVAETKLKRPWLQALIGNAITLTPGTVTIHLNEGSYIILWLYPTSIRQKQIRKQLIKDFETPLEKGDKDA